MGTTTTPKTVRALPGWQIVRRLKAVKTTQADIAQRAGVGPTFVHSVIYRRPSADPERAARVWQEIERALNGQAA